MKMVFVLGTRPEAIKMAPLIRCARKEEGWDVKVCFTGQHREMPLPVLNFFDIVPDIDLELMLAGQSLSDITSLALTKLYTYFQTHKFDWVFVQGDTTTCFAASLAAFYAGAKVAHVEAGLRSGDIFSPYPEEFNRKAVSLLAQLHLAPTEGARQSLLNEGIPKQNVFNTGNTVIDALRIVSQTLSSNSEVRAQYEKRFSYLNDGRKMVLFTIHRRESFGETMESILLGLHKFARAFPNVDIVFPVHPNPSVKNCVTRVFADKPKNLHLESALDYLSFVFVMNKAYFIVTDSGGIQEEGPYLGKPILVTREKTERKESIECGSSRLIPLTSVGVFENMKNLLENEGDYKQMVKKVTPYGDGHSSEKIIEVFKKFCSETTI